MVGTEVIVPPKLQNCFTDYIQGSTEKEHGVGTKHDLQKRFSYLINKLSNDSAQIRHCIVVTDIV